MEKESQWVEMEDTQRSEEARIWPRTGPQKWSRPRHLYKRICATISACVLIYLVHGA